MVSALARVEVAAALWRKHRIGELAREDAAHDVDPGCEDFACFDAALRTAAAAQGLRPVP